MEKTFDKICDLNVFSFLSRYDYVMILFFYSLYSGQRVTLSDFGILGNC